MMRAPALAAIHAAELRVAQSGRNTRDGLRRARVAFRATLARPATLALVAGAAGLAGFWLVRRPRRQAPSTTEAAGVGKKASAVGVALAYIVRYGMPRVPFFLQQVRAALQKRLSCAAPDMSNRPATDHSATGVRR
jgi:hypothetical protein